MGQDKRELERYKYLAEAKQREVETLKKKCEILAYREAGARIAIVAIIRKMFGGKELSGVIKLTVENYELEEAKKAKTKVEVIDTGFVIVIGEEKDDKDKL